MSESSEELKRIAAAIEEILRLVKKDMETYEKKKMKAKPVGVNVLDIKFYKYDEDGNDILNKDGTTKEFQLKGMRFKPLEYLCEELSVDDVEEIKK